MSVEVGNGLTGRGRLGRADGWPTAVGPSPWAPATVHEGGPGPAPFALSGREGTAAWARAAEWGHGKDTDGQT